MYFLKECPLEFNFLFWGGKGEIEEISNRTKGFLDVRQSSDGAKVTAKGKGRQFATIHLYFD